MTDYRMIFSMEIPPQLAYVSKIIGKPIENRLRKSGREYTFKNIGGLFVWTLVVDDEQRKELEDLNQDKDFKRLQSFGVKITLDFVDEAAYQEAGQLVKEGGVDGGKV